MINYFFFQIRAKKNKERDLYNSNHYLLSNAKFLSTNFVILVMFYPVYENKCEQLFIPNPRGNLFPVDRL